MRFLGIDYGRRRIGLALSDATGMLARPWKMIPREGNTAQVARTLGNELTASSPKTTGSPASCSDYPRRLGGEPTDQTAAVDALAVALRAHLDRWLADHAMPGTTVAATLPVVLQDERLSSREAESLLAQRIKNWRDRKSLLDAASAAVILQDFLDSRASARITHEDTRS